MEVSLSVALSGSFVCVGDFVGVTPSPDLAFCLVLSFEFCEISRHCFSRSRDVSALVHW